MTVMTVHDVQWLNLTRPAPEIEPLGADMPTLLAPELDIDAIFTELAMGLADLAAEMPSIVDAETYGRHAYVEPELESLETLADMEAANHLVMLQIAARRGAYAPLPSVQVVPQPASEPAVIVMERTAEGVWTAPTGEQRALPSVDIKAGDKMAAGFAAAGIALNVDGHRDDTWGERIHDRIERAVARLFRRRA